MKLWWLSFASDDGFLGACIVQAEDEVSAVFEATSRGINPGGEVAMMPVPEDCREFTARYKNRILDRSECERVFGPSADPEEWSNDADLAIVHEKCNPK